MSKNKLAKFAELEGMSHVLQYPFARLRNEEFPFKGKWHADFFKNNNPVVIELGCGKGEYTVGLARRNTDVNYIGMDVKGARIWSGAKIVLEEQLKNAAFVRGEIEMLDRFFVPGEVSEIWITFPNPQMKKVNKRLTSTRFMDIYRSVLSPGGLIHLKTDSAFLYTYTKAMIELNGLAVMADTDDLYHGVTMEHLNVPDIRTYYEKQWLDRGLTIKYLCFKPGDKSIPLTEPDIEIEFDSYRSFGRNYSTTK